MPTSAPGSNRRAQSGLTLVEVLAVIGLSALMTAVVLLTVAPGTSDAETAARGFAGRVAGLSDRAVVTGRAVGLSAGAELTIHDFGADGWSPAGTVALPEGVQADPTAEDELLPQDPVPKGTLVIYRPPGEEAQEEVPPPPVTFGATGEATPFSAVFDDGDEAWIVSVGPFGDVEVAREE